MLQCSFCHHEVPSFAPWHRPYCLLFEQGLRRACNTVAGRFKTAALRSNATYTCDLLRAPYWDATTRSAPGLFLTSTVQVYDSDGKNLVIMGNPLMTFCFRVSCKYLGCSTRLYIDTFLSCCRCTLRHCTRTTYIATFLAHKIQLK